MDHLAKSQTPRLLEPCNIVQVSGHRGQIILHEADPLVISSAVQYYRTRDVQGHLNAGSYQAKLLYLCESDKKVVDRALSGKALDEDDSDDFLDLFARVDCG